MRFSQLGAISIALLFNVLGAGLSVTSTSRSLVAPAAAQTTGNQGEVFRMQIPQYSPPVTQQTVSDRLAQADQLLAEGAEQLKTSQYQEAFQSWQQALTIFQENSVRNQQPNLSLEGEALALMRLGILYSRFDNNQKAIEYYQQALPIFQTLRHRNGEGSTLTNLGVTYEKLKEYQRSADYCNQAVIIFRELNDRSAEATALGDLANAYMGLTKYQQGIEYYQQALSIYQELGDQLGKGTVLLNLGVALGEMKGYEEGIAYYRRALPIFRELGDRDTEGLLLANIGKLYLNYDSPESAIQFLQQSVEVRQSVRAEMRQLSPQIQQSYVNSFARDYRLLADLLKQQNRQDEAQRILALL